ALLEQRETAPRARIVAEHVATLIPDSAVAVYLAGTGQQPLEWIPKATAGDIAIDAASETFDPKLLRSCATSKRIELFSAANLTREDYLHLDVRRTVTSIGYVPIQLGE